jgi:hypothetical protein
MTILDQHVHMPDARPKQPHRLVALDGWHLRCIDCQQTLDLRSLATQQPPHAEPGTSRTSATSTPASSTPATGATPAAPAGPSTSPSPTTRPPPR